MKSREMTAADFDSVWLEPPERLILGSNAVHVWRVSLDQSPSQIALFQNNLDDDERSRADRFYFRRDRERFIVARGVLRALLGRYLNRAPESLSFSYSTHGKPALVSESDADAIRFNLSHSHGTALYAVVAAVRSASISSSSGANWRRSKSPNDFSRTARSWRSGRSRSAFGNTHSFSVGLARKPTSRPEVKDSRCPWISSTCR